MKHCIFINGEKTGVIQQFPEFKERIYFAVLPKLGMASIDSPLSVDSISIRQIEYKMTFASVDRECGLYTTNGDWREIISGGDWIVPDRTFRKRHEIIIEEPISRPKRVSVRNKIKRALLECHEGRIDGAEYFLKELLDDLESESFV